MCEQTFQQSTTIQLKDDWKKSFYWFFEFDWKWRVTFQLRGNEFEYFSMELCNRWNKKRLTYMWCNLMSKEINLNCECPLLVFIRRNQISDKHFKVWRIKIPFGFFCFIIFNPKNKNKSLRNSQEGGRERERLRK